MKDKLQMLTQQRNQAMTNAVIQERILGQAREETARIEGQIGLLNELIAESDTKKAKDKKTEKVNTDDV